MSAIFITGAGTDIGKTHIACALLSAWRAQGVACDALKPVVSGFDPEAPAGSDPVNLLEALGREVSAEAIARIAPLRFRAPLAPPLAAKLEDMEINFDALLEFCRIRTQLTEGVLLIEGAGGVMSPLTEARTFLDLIAALEAPALFVAGSYLGAVSHALTGLECLRMRGVSVAAVIVNESEENAGLQETRDMIQRMRPDLPVYAAVRAAPIDDWAQALTQTLG
ncbi:MAG TPA: dethiobiotin synthase [Caulobacterales bacterium]|nr:dethiobiotin synthase [Caulobacterales bacterium]